MGAGKACIVTDATPPVSPIRTTTHPAPGTAWRASHTPPTILINICCGESPLLFTCFRSLFIRLLSHRSRVALLMAAMLATACQEPDHLDAIREAGVLRVVTRNGPTTYYQDRHGPAGFEYELALRFASELGVELEIRTEHSLEALFQALERGEADIAAAGLTITPERRTRLNFSTPYMDILQYVLYRRGETRPREPADLIGKRLHLMAHSSHAETLRQLQKEHPQLLWVESTDVETVDLLDMLEDGVIDHTVIDSNEFLANRSFYLGLGSAFPLGPPSQLAWAMSRSDSSQRLHQEVDRFFTEQIGQGRINQLIERFYSHSEDNNQVDSQTFTRALSMKLAQYESLIKSVAQEYELDWRLLAAISYQESHWDPLARSPTGVRGMMMLTLPTAQAMGVTNRLDAEQSLRGGARYFRQIHRRIAPTIEEPDRTWFALAAYNVGLGHLNDARAITAEQGSDPDRWADVKKRLPLLARRKYYQHTRYGYARGSEPVNYVQNIRHYYNLMTWPDLARERTPPPQSMDQYLPDMVKTGLNAL